MASARFVARTRPARVGVAMSAVMAIATLFSGAQVALGGGTVVVRAAQVAASADTGAQLYIVQVAGAPIASYTGDVKGFKATKPAKGQKVDTRSAAAQAYRGHLDAVRNAVLKGASLAGRKAEHVYDVALNGFAMKLTAAEANRLQHTSGVLHVWANQIYKADTVSTPTFLGLDGSTGVWARQYFVEQSELSALRLARFNRRE